MKRKNNHIESLRTKLIYFAAFIVFIVPLIVFLKKFKVFESATFLYGPTEYAADFFAYYKAMVLQIGAVILLFSTLWVKWKEAKKEKKVWKLDLFEILLLSFGAVVILSFVFSEFKSVAWLGWLDRFEGTATWLSYIALAYSLHTLVRTKKEAHLLIGSFVLSSLVVSLIGVFQYKGIDLFQTNFGKKLILGSYYDQLGESLKFKFEEGRVYGTLYNPNYVGSLVALAFPLSLYMFTQLKSWIFRPIIILTLVLHIIVLAGSNSTTGFFAVGVSVFVFFIMLFFQKNVSKKILITSGLLIVIILIGVSQTSLFQNQYNKLKNNITNMESEYNPFTKVEYNHPILTVYIDNGAMYHITPVGYSVEVYDEEWNLLERQDLEDRHQFRLINQYDILVEKIHNTGRINVSVINDDLGKGKVMRFDLVNENQFSLGYDLFTDEKLSSDVEVIKISSSDHFFTNRGYIWNRSIPLIIKKPLLGYGADTYILNFPHLDLIARPESMRDDVVDKPHNIYIQILYNFGFVGGFLFLSLVCYTLWKMRSSLLIAAIIGWLVVGIGNDSVVFVTYMLFCMMGLANLFSLKKEVSK